MGLPCAASLFYFVFFSDRYVARIVYGAAKIFTAVWPVISVWFIFRTGLPKIDLRHERHRKAIPLGILSGLAIVVLLLGVMQTPLGEEIARNSENIRRKAQELGFLRYYWPFGLFLSLVNSLIEEYYWRWFTFGHLREVVNTLGAHVLAGVAFASHHVVVASQFFPGFWGLALGGCVGVAGVLWSVMYQKQKTLVGAWLSHLIADLGVMGIGYGLLFGSHSI
jgi:membrane protease YdiL (CAAX protease family)